MPLSKDDRISFSLQIVAAAEKIKGIETAKAQLLLEVDKAQKLDTANKNLFDPVNARANGYQLEITQLDGNVRTTFGEQEIQDSANRKIGNFFFPNDISQTIPSLAATNNIWTKIKPFAIAYGIGKNYSEAFPSIVPKEQDKISACLSYISAAATYTDMENTTGQNCTGIDTIATYPVVQTLKTNLVTAVNDLKTFLLAEVALITTDDPNTTNQANNNAAINNINAVIIPALNLWLGYADFNTAHGQTTCIGFSGFNANLLAPTKLHSTQLAALQSALNTRAAFVTTRTAQVSAVLGSINQDVSTGDLISSSGLYGLRYNFMLLRLNVLGGSLIALNGMNMATGAQDQIIAGIKSNAATYMSLIPTSILAAPATGTAIVSLTDASFLSVGDAVWVMAEGQEELQRAVKAIDGKMVTLNDVIPSKYRPSEKARLYKDLT